MKNIKWITAAFALVCGLSFTSCDKDDDRSQDEMYKDFISNASDVRINGLYGNVKSVTEKYYEDNLWDSRLKMVTPGYLDHQDIINYSPEGYVTSVLSRDFIPPYELGSDPVIDAYDTFWTYVSRDNKYRPTVIEARMYSSLEGIMVEFDNTERWTITYDDAAGKATIIISYSEDNTTFEDYVKIVAELINGRLDYTFYYGDFYSFISSYAGTLDIYWYVPEIEQQSVERNAAEVSLPNFKENTMRDENRNITSYYRVQIDAEDEDNSLVSDYYTISYLYY